MPTGQEKKRHFGPIRLDPERPSPTILGDTGCTTAGLVHLYEIRKLSIAEIKALASYPEEFQFVGSHRARWARVGNSVPPLFMKAIAEHIPCRFFMKKSLPPSNPQLLPRPLRIAYLLERDFAGVSGFHFYG